MSNYTTYICSVCKRAKDFLTDNIRVIPNQCTITKGCEGRLSVLGQSSILHKTPSIAGLTDWYPRGVTVSENISSTIVDTISLSSSSTGLLTIGIKVDSTTVTANPQIKMKLIQRRVEDIAYQTYSYKLSVSTSLVSGRDSTGKNMRFDQTAIDDNRVTVNVNGVSRTDAVLTPNTVSFPADLPVNSNIDVTVLLEKDTVERILTFTSNVSIGTAGQGAWGNLKWIKHFNNDIYWLYTAPDLGAISDSSNLKIDNVYLLDGTAVLTELGNVFFMLSSVPYSNIDRYRNFFVRADNLELDFNISTAKTTVTEFTVLSNMLSEIYPPFVFEQNSNPVLSSYIKPDVLPISDGSTKADSSIQRLPGVKIIGPV